MVLCPVARGSASHFALDVMRDPWNNLGIEQVGSSVRRRRNRCTSYNCSLPSSLLLCTNSSSSCKALVAVLYPVSELLCTVKSARSASQEYFPCCCSQSLRSCHSILNPKYASTKQKERPEYHERFAYVEEKDSLA